jgi:hypothetical protein
MYDALGVKLASLWALTCVVDMIGVLEPTDAKPIASTTSRTEELREGA